MLFPRRGRTPSAWILEVKHSLSALFAMGGTSSAMAQRTVPVVALAAANNVLTSVSDGCQDTGKGHHDH
jgi:hypothetical protein